MVSSNLVKKKLEQKLFERTKELLLSDYDNFCKLWDFGGIVLVNAENKKLGCIAPDGDWKEFVIKNYADLMIEKKEETPPPPPQEEKPAEPKTDEAKNETPGSRRRPRR